MAIVKTPIMLLPGHTPAIDEKGNNPDEDRLIQCTPNTMAPKTPMVRTRPELLRAYNFRSLGAGVGIAISAIQYYLLITMIRWMKSAQPQVQFDIVSLLSEPPFQVLEKPFAKAR
jgi:hypothetical protein